LIEDQQNQNTDFSTGEWSRPPELFGTAENLILRLESESSVEFKNNRPNKQAREEKRLSKIKGLSLFCS
jgi:hypothetical protein